jgi:hypothetical protein
LLPNQKSTAKAESEIGSENYIAADSEINSKNCGCRFRNRQAKTASLSIQKSAAKNFA